MNDRANDRLWRNMLLTVLDGDTVSAGNHVAEDDELLACWGAGLLTPHEVEAITDHVAHCGRCRRELAQLMRSGLFDGFPDVTKNSADLGTADQNLPRLVARSPKSARRAIDVPHRFGSRRTWYAAVATASALAASMFGIWFALAPVSNPDHLLARAEKQLASGQSHEALQTAVSILDQHGDDPASQQAGRIWEQAAYRLASKALEDRQFAEVIDLGREGAIRDVGSARLVNLKIAAERKIPNELALAQAGSLTSYGFELDGSLPRKALPTLDETSDRLQRELRQAVARYPDDATLRINLGQFLLQQGQPAKAREEFSVGAAIDSRSREAQLGLGLAAASLGEWKTALKQFETVLQIDAKSFAAALNAAIAAQHLGQGELAQRFFQRALALSTDADLRKRIESRISSP